MSYNDTINYLYGLQKHGIKLGLDNIVRLLSYFGNPQTSFSSIHVAGTNGKGSTSAMIASILQAAGLKVGLFTSPHLVSFTERIRVNNEEITEPEVIELTEEIRCRMQDAGCKVPITFFEFVTTMGFLYFKRENIDWAVVETGMGGRLDATNILIPEVSVITSVSYDHKEFLGNTICEIAGEKAGIIKNGVPVVCAMQEKEAEDIIRTRAEGKSSPLFTYGKDFNGILRLSDTKGITFDYTDGGHTIKDVFVPLAGEHQLFNACLAIKASIIALKNSFKVKDKKHSTFNIQHSTDFIREGLAATKWPGRLELISDNPPILIDGAHNPSASAVLADSLKKNFLTVYKRIILIMGIMADKDLNGIMVPLLPLASEIILTAPAYERAASPQKLAEYASAMGYQNIHISQTVRDAIDMAIKISKKSEVKSKQSKLPTSHFPLPTSYPSLILITGSFYTIGEAKEILKGKGILSRLRE